MRTVLPLEDLDMSRRDVVWAEQNKFAFLANTSIVVEVHNGMQTKMRHSHVTGAIQLSPFFQLELRQRRSSSLQCCFVPECRTPPLGCATQRL